MPYAPSRRRPVLPSTLTPQQRAAYQQQFARARLGAPPEEDENESWFGRLFPDIVEDAVTQIATSLIHTPAALYQLGKGAALDARDLVTEGDVTPERLGGFGEAMARGLYEDFRHPRENIGYLLMDLFGAASLGAGAAARLGGAARAARAAKARPGGDPPLLPPGASLPPDRPLTPGGAMAAEAAATRAATRAPSFRATFSDPPELRARREAREAAAAEDPPRWSAPDPVEALEQRLPGLIRPKADPGDVHYFTRDWIWKLRSGDLDLEFRDLRGNVYRARTVAKDDPRSIERLFEALRNTPDEQLSVIAPRVVRRDAPLGSEAARPVPVVPVAGPRLPAEEGATGRYLSPDDELIPPEAFMRLGDEAPMAVQQAAQSKWPEQLRSSVSGVTIQRVREGQEYRNFDDFWTLEKERFKTPEGKDAEAVIYQALDEGGNPVGSVVMNDLGDALEVSTIVLDRGADARVLRDLLSPVLNSKRPVIGDALNERWRSVLMRAAKKNPNLRSIRDGESGKTIGNLLDEADAPKPDVPEEALARLTEAVDEQAAKQAGRKQRLEQLRAEEAKLRERPRVVLDPKARALVAEGTSLSARQIGTLRDKRPVFRLHDGDKPFGPPIAGLKEAKENLEIAAVQKRAGQPLDIVNVPDSDAARGVAMGDVIEPLPAKQAALAKRAAEPTPRQTGESARAKSLSPRDLLVNPRNLQKAGLSEQQARQLSQRLARDLRVIWEDARTQGKTRPHHQQIIAVLSRHLGDRKAAQELYRRIYASKGGSDFTARDFIRELMKGPEPGVYTLRRQAEVDRKLKFPTHTFTEKVPKTERVDVPLSRNALIRPLQRKQLQWLERHPERSWLTRTVGLGRDLNARFEFERRELARTAGIARAIGLIKSKEEVEEAGKRRRLQVEDVVDTTNQLAKIAALFLKPAYIPANLLGQIAISAADRGPLRAFLPHELWRSVRQQHAIFGKDRVLGEARAQKIRAAMGEGVAKSLLYERGASEKIGRAYAGMAEVFNRILDTPFRDAAFLWEARRHGFTTVEDLERLLDAAPNTPLGRKFDEIARRANQNIVDFGRLGPNEKRWLRRAVFFYPWFKGASLYAGHWASNHPGQFLVAAQAGRVAAERTKEELGPVPSYVEGSFKVGERDVPGVGKAPLIVNPSAFTVLGTPGEVISALSGALTGGAKEADQPSEFLTPALSAFISATTRVDPFTGRTFPAQMSAPEIAAQELLQTVAPARTFQGVQRARGIESGEVDASEILYPRNVPEELGRYFVGVAPFAINPKEARSRAFAEERSLASRRQREILKHRDYRNQFREALVSTGILAKGQRLPQPLSQAFALRAQREAEIAVLGTKLGRELRQLDRLQADLQVLVRRGVMDERQARDLLAQAVDIGDQSIRSLRRRLGEAYFGGEIISAYKRAANARGAGLTVP